MTSKFHEKQQFEPQKTQYDFFALGPVRALVSTLISTNHLPASIPDKVLFLFWLDDGGDQSQILGGDWWWQACWQQLELGPCHRNASSKSAFVRKLLMHEWLFQVKNGLTKYNAYRLVLLDKITVKYSNSGKLHDHWSRMYLLVVIIEGKAWVMYLTTYLLVSKDINQVQPYHTYPNLSYIH